MTGLLQRGKCLLLDREFEPRGELDRTQDSDRVLAEADLRFADGADQLAAQVAQPVGVIEHGLVAEVVEQ